MGYRCIESWNVNFGAPRESAKMQKNVSCLCKKGSLYGILEDWANKMCINCHQFACSAQMMIRLNALFSAMWPSAGILAIKHLGKAAAGCSPLPVGCTRAVFAHVVVFADILRQTPFGRAQQHASEGGPGDVFNHVGMLDRVHRGLAPGERRMPRYQDPGNRYGIQILPAEASHDHGPGIAHVSLPHL